MERAGGHEQNVICADEAVASVHGGAFNDRQDIALNAFAANVGAVTAFAAGLGEFGAVITFVSNIPGITRTLPLALYTALQTPDGDATAARLAITSFTLGLAGLVLSEVLARGLRRQLGRGGS